MGTAAGKAVGDVMSNRATTMNRAISDLHDRAFFTAISFILSENDDRDGSPKNEQIQSHRFVVGIFRVQPDPLVIRKSVPSADLPQPGYSGIDLAVVVIALAIPMDLRGHDRAGPDHAHFAPEYVEQLGK